MCEGGDEDWFTPSRRVIENKSGFQGSECFPVVRPIRRWTEEFQGVVILTDTLPSNGDFLERIPLLGLTLGLEQRGIRLLLCNRILFPETVRSSFLSSET